MSGQHLKYMRDLDASQITAVAIRQHNNAHARCEFKPDGIVQIYDEYRNEQMTWRSDYGCYVGWPGGRLGTLMVYVKEQTGPTAV